MHAFKKNCKMHFVEASVLAYKRNKMSALSKNLGFPYTYPNEKEKVAKVSFTIDAF